MDFDPHEDICEEIAEGRSLDVLEIDGASNRGIDHIRDLRDNVRFAPSRGNFRIVYIDEVHMLTKESFNALLKTLEEQGMIETEGKAILIYDSSLYPVQDKAAEDDAFDEDE